MRRWLLLLLLLALPAHSQIPFPGPGRASTSGGGGPTNLCSSYSGLFCMDFSADSSAGTCDAESPAIDAEAGQSDCDCTTSTGCFNSNFPPSVPLGESEVLTFNNNGGSVASSVGWTDDIDDADAADTQYARFCYYASGDANEDSFRGIFYPYTGGSTFHSGGGTTTQLQTFLDTTPQIRAQCTGFETGTAISFTNQTWNEITVAFTESTCVFEVCVNDANGGTNCQSCDGTSCPGTLWDGVLLSLSYQAFELGTAYTHFSNLRIQSTPFSASGGDNNECDVD